MKRGQALKDLLFCLISAFFILLVCSRSSPLYVFNNWDDANSYFTVGKGLMNGLLPYRDLYDQKGPYLYLVYGLAWLLSHRTFAGVFLLETVSLTAFLYYSNRIMRLYAGRTACLALTPVLGAVVCTSEAFYWGGSAEEIFLPLLAMGLYDCLDYMRTSADDTTSSVNSLREGSREPLNSPLTVEVNGSVLPPAGMVFRNALAAGILMQVKYTWLGFYLAFAFVFSLKLLSMGQGKKIIRYFFIFVGGMLLSMVPWLLFFGVRGGLHDWYSVYVYDNVFLYSHLSQKERLTDALHRLERLMYWQLRDDPGYYVPLFIGLFGALIEKGQGVIERLAPWWLFLFTFLGIFYAGGSLPYYCLTLSVFAPVGMGYVGKAACAVTRGKLKGKIPTAVLIPALSAALSLAVSFFVTPNRDFMRETRDSFFLFSFADTVNEDPDATLLNVNCLDAGLYTLTGIIPDCRYFQTNTLGVPVIEEGQKRYVKEGKTEYIIARDALPYTVPEFYEEVDSADYPTNGVDHTYILYRKR